MSTILDPQTATQPRQAATMQGETRAQGSDTPSLSIVMEDRKASRANPAKASADKLNFWYGTNQAPRTSTW